MINESGLRPLPKDSRDFALGAIIDLPELSELPEQFAFPTLNVKHQHDSDFCTAFASCTVSELQEQVELEPSWSFAMTKDLEGDHNTWGADLRVALKAHTKYGALPKSKSPYSLETKGATFLRNPEVWDQKLLETAYPYRKKSYFAITGPYDTFDNIRASIWHYREKKQAVVTGVVWCWGRNQTELKNVCLTGFGHAVPIIGWDGDYLIIQNSYGLTAGDNGQHKLHRDIVNADAGRFGAFMLVDIDRTDAQYLVDNKLKEHWSTLRRWLQLLVNIFS